MNASEVACPKLSTVHAKGRNAAGIRPKASLNIGRWSISLEPEYNGELIAGVTKERGLRAESGTHQFGVALLATVNVQLKSCQNRVMFGLGFCSGHAQTVRTRLRTSTDRFGQ
jgi:hypothetical protein